MRRLNIIGAGGHGKVCADIAEKLGDWDEVVFVDQKFPGLKSCGAWAVIGNEISQVADPGDEFFVAIGDNQTRLRIYKGCLAAGFKPVVLIHPKTVISQYSQIGSGSLVCASAVVNVDAVIGECSIVNTAVTIDHDCQIGVGVHLSPGVHLAGEVRIGSYSWLGAGAATKEGLSIGSKVVIGVGAAVVHDCIEQGTYVGVPAKRIK